LSYNVEIQNREEDWKNDFWTCDTSKEKGRKSSSLVTRRRYPDGIGILRISFSSTQPDAGMLKYFEFSSLFVTPTTNLYKIDKESKSSSKI
jgi:hypothetical protein